MIGFAISVFVFCFIIHSYPLLRLTHWFYNSNLSQNLIVLIIAAIFAALVIIVRVIDEAKLALALMSISNYLLGFFIYLFLFVLIAEIVLFFGLIKAHYLAIFSILAAFVLTLIGVYLFQTQFKVIYHTIESDKISKAYQIIHLTDTQYGTLNNQDIKKIANKVNQVLLKEKIDAILFTGDAIDSKHFEFDNLKDLDFKNVPKFFSLGNHEYYHNYSKILALIEQLGYQILSNKNTSLAELNLIGIDDPNPMENNANWLAKQLKDDFILKDKLNILLYHRPTEVLIAKEKGIDLMLAGHTHGGQFFPITLILKLIYDFPQGLVKIDNFYLYTSDGAGLWGPKLRLGTSNEIAVIRLKNKSNQ